MELKDYSKKVLIGQLPTFVDKSLITNAPKHIVYNYVYMFLKQLRQTVSIPYDSSFVLQQDTKGDYYVYFKYDEDNESSKKLAENIEDIIPDEWNVWTHMTVSLLTEPELNTEMFQRVFGQEEPSLLEHLMIYTKDKQYDIYVSILRSEIVDLLSKRADPQEILESIKLSNIPYIVKTLTINA